MKTTLASLSKVQMSEVISRLDTAANLHVLPSELVEREREVVSKRVAVLRLVLPDR